MTKKYFYAGLIILIASSLLLAACSAQETPAAAPTIDANMIYTQAAQTVQAGLAQTQVTEPTAAATEAPAPTATMDPNVALAMTATAQSVQPQPGNANPTATTAPGAQPATTATATLQALPKPTKSAAPPKATGDKAVLVGQVPGDGSTISKNASFDVALTLKNTGVTTWTNKYRLAFYAGDKMGSPNDVVMTKDVKPGDSITLAFTMKAGDSLGKKQTIWVMQNPEGVNFYSLWLETNVIN
jgi:hypothetical protein